MNDLTVLLIGVMVASLILYLVSFKMWWMVLILGGGLWMLLRFITGLFGADSPSVVSPELIERAKTFVTRYLEKQGWTDI